MQKVYVIPSKSIKKKIKISCPASLKKDAGFIFADNPNRGENILKTLWFFLSVRVYQKVYGYIFFMDLP